MTPSIFQCAAQPAMSEIDIARGWGSTDNARAALEHHWDSFINFSDFQYLASIGINTVRLPIGYWNLGPDFCQGTPFESVASAYTTSWKRVLRAVNYAASVGIGVLIDLHGAPGSQNGQPHSGISDGVTGLFNSDDYKKKTVDVLKFLVKTFSAVTNVVGVQLLNEPENDPSLATFCMSTIECPVIELELIMHCQIMIRLLLSEDYRPKRRAFRYIFMMDLICSVSVI